jgi:hypothetical protein
MLPDFLLFLDGFSGGGTEPTLAGVLGHHYMRLPGAVPGVIGEERHQVLYSIIWISLRQINLWMFFLSLVFINIESY